jgi:hypothetical protein
VPLLSAAGSRLRAVTERPGGWIRMHGPRVLAGLWIAAVIVVSVQAAAHRSNNFEIFRTSWDNLVAGRDLYAASPRHRDVFLYSPPFALLFAPFAVVPIWLGVLLWNGVNAAALYWGLGRILSPDQAFAARAIVFLDAVGSMQNVQSNALVAGLMIVAFGELERRHEFRASLAVVCGTAIKIFPIVAAVFAVFRPWRLPRFALYCVLVGVLLLATPLLVTPAPTLLNQYRSWLVAENAITVQRNYSVMQHVHMWLPGDWPNGPIQLVGVIMLLSPLVRLPSWGSLRFRLLFLASALMFCVLFNHKAESPSFVIAVAGVAIWFAMSDHDRLAWAVLAIVAIGTVLSASDAMPEILQQRFFQPYRIKTLPILLVWILTQVQLWRRSESARPRASAANPAVLAT